MVDPAAPSESPADPSLAPRIRHHREMESKIRGLSDDELLELLSDSELPDDGRAAISLPRGGAMVFVKLLPLTFLELQPRHRHSTANLFHLPTHYHYRLGSLGFGAWRELEVHRMANRWVLSGDCPGFPLLHGWRILPKVHRGRDDRSCLDPWGEDPAIRRRVSAVAESTASAALFLEHFPMTLGQRFRDRPPGLPDPMAAILETEAPLLEIMSFMNGRGLLHMDAHFENILTDGSRLFLGDFGLAISRSFRLDSGEHRFLERHGNFDGCTAVTSLVHALVTRCDPKEDWRRTLRELNEGTHTGIGKFPAAVRSYLWHRGPLALAVGDFYRRLTADLATEYPSSALQGLLTSPRTAPR